MPRTAPPVPQALPTSLPNEDSDGTPDCGPEGSPLLRHVENSEAMNEALFLRVAWRIIPLLWLGYVLNIIDRTNLAYAQLQMKSDLDLNAREFGYASGIFFISCEAHTSCLVAHGR